MRRAVPQRPFLAALLVLLLGLLTPAPAAAAGAAGTVLRHTPVVFVHGYGDTAAAFDGFEDYLHAHGYLGSDLAEWGYDWTESNAANADRFGAFLDRAFPGRQVDVVAHSMGSLVTRRYLKDGGAARVRAWVSLGGPNHGAGDAVYCGPFGPFCDLHAASLAEMAPGSAFLTALNDGDETPGATRYLTFSSACDQQVPPGDSRIPESTRLAGAENILLPVGDSGCPSHGGLLGNDWIRQRILTEFAADPAEPVTPARGPFRITVNQARLTGSEENAPEIYDGITLTTDGTTTALWHRDRAAATAFPDWDPWYGLDDTARSRVFTDEATIRVTATDADYSAGNNDDVLAAGRVHWDGALGFGRHTALFHGVDGGEVTVVYTVTPEPAAPVCRIRVDRAELAYFDDGTTRPALYGDIAVRTADGTRTPLWSRSADSPATFPNKGARTDPDPYFYQRIGAATSYGPGPLELSVRLWDHDASSADDLVARGTADWNPYGDAPGTRTTAFQGDDGGRVEVTWTVLCG